MNIPSNHNTTLKVFPDGDTTICLGGQKHLLNMGLTKDNLVPSRKIIQTVGGFTLMCQGWQPVEFVVKGKKLNKPSTYARTSNDFTFARQLALMWEYCMKIF